MALRAIKRVFNRTSPVNVSKRLFPDLTFTKSARKQSDGSMLESLDFTISAAKFEGLGLDNHEVGVTVLRDDENNKVYFAIVPKKDAEVLKGKADRKKGRKFNYNEAVKELVEVGLLDGEIGVGYKQTFDLVDSDQQLEGVIKLTEIVKKEASTSGLPADEIGSEETQVEESVVEEDTTSDVVEDDEF